VVLASAAAVVLGCFVRPTVRHLGINQYDKSKFLDLVEGTAHKPFVYRALLPAVVRAASAAVPRGAQEACARAVERQPQAAEVFEGFHWETAAAFQYLVACLLMGACFLGFGHYAGRLAAHLAGLPETGKVPLLLGTGALLGLPPLFTYASYPYDPPQLFLFTLALHSLAVGRLRRFGAAFAACCFNKETAVLLIPVFGLLSPTRRSDPARHRAAVIALVVAFVAVKAFLTWTFHANGGSFVELHPRHNVLRLLRGWSFADLLVVTVLGTLVLFRWREKPRFLRVSLPWVLVPLASLALFLGYVDEWRGYFEAYPLAYASAVHSVRQLREALGDRLAARSL
jgi:hypothetical protein